MWGNVVMSIFYLCKYWRFVCLLSSNVIFPRTFKQDDSRKSKFCLHIAKKRRGDLFKEKTCFLYLKLKENDAQKYLIRINRNAHSISNI